MQLSNECRDLLDRIFEADVKKRITVDGIMQHPWYTQPLPSQYQSQLQHLEQVQVELEAHMKSRQIDPVCLPPPLTDLIGIQSGIFVGYHAYSMSKHAVHPKVCITGCMRYCRPQLRS